MQVQAADNLILISIVSKIKFSRFELKALN
jgi:hypothetical protein